MKRRFVFTGLCIVLAVLLSGCALVQRQPDTTPEPTKTVRPHVTVTPEATLSNPPAALIEGINTSQKVVSVIFEGYSDESTMQDVLDAVKQAGIPTTFFISGITASEQQDVVQKIVASGCEIGNYTLHAEKKMETNTVNYNVHQLSKTQELILRACGMTPILARLNGTQYTDAVLRAVTAGGLSAAVEPGLYLNHHSFASEGDAQTYVQNMVRGAIISIKLGQELDIGEFGDESDALDERPAIDPQASIDENMISTTKANYGNIGQVVTWLLGSLAQNGYTVVPVVSLSSYAEKISGQQLELDEHTLELLSADRYDLPVTQNPIGTTDTHTGTAADFDGAVFVGDAVMDGLREYVQWRRLNSPDFMGNAQFLTSSSFTVETALSEVTNSSQHPVYNGEKMTIEDALHAMGAQKVYLQMRFGNRSAYAQETYLKNLELLIYLIRQKNPGIEVVVLSILPGVSERTGVPTNMQIFRYNLMVCSMCLRSGIPYLDAAYVFRDTDGGLLHQYCVDANTYGTHLNDAGCDRLIEYLTSNIP